MTKTQLILKDAEKFAKAFVDGDVESDAVLGGALAHKGAGVIYR
jgi:hypothetical protein